MGKLFTAKQGFTAYNFEVLKVYCFYDIEVRPGDVIEIVNHDPVWGFAFVFDTEICQELAYSRVAEKDHWLVDLQLARSQGRFGGLFAPRDAPVNKDLNRKGIDPDEYLQEVRNTRFR